MNDRLQGKSALDKERTYSEHEVEIIVKLVDAMNRAIPWGIAALACMGWGMGTILIYMIVCIVEKTIPNYYVLVIIFAQLIFGAWCYLKFQKIRILEMGMTE